jgi:hypothetical protein
VLWTEWLAILEGVLYLIDDLQLVLVLPQVIPLAHFSNQVRRPLFSGTLDSFLILLLRYWTLVELLEVLIDGFFSPVDDVACLLAEITQILLGFKLLSKHNGLIDITEQ